jgi:predicted dehydrogenase
MNALLVGCGRHAVKNIIPALNETGAIETLHLYDTSDLAVGNALVVARMPTKRVADFRLALDRCDLVIVAVSPSMNRIVLQECRGRTVPVLVEKPPAVSSREWKRVLEMASVNEVYVGLNYRFSPAVQAFRDAADPGRFPYIDIRYFSRHPFGPENGLPPLRAWVIGNLIHICSLIHYWYGQPLEIRGSCTDDTRSEVYLCAALIYAGGRIVSLSAGNVTPRFDISMVGRSVDGEVVTMLGCETVTITSRDNGDRADCVGERLLFRGNAATFISRGYLCQFAALSGSTTDRHQVATAEDGLEALCLCERILDACHRGC